METFEYQEILRLLKDDSTYLYRYGSLGESLDRFKSLTEQEKRILLCLALEKGDQDLHKVAYFLLSRLEPPAGDLKELKKQLSSWGKATLRRINREWDNPIKPELSFPLKTLKASSNTNKELLRKLQGKNADDRWMAAQLLGEQRYNGAIKNLIKALKDEEQKVRIRVIWALGNIGDSKATKPLLKLLKDDGCKERGFVVEALAKIEGIRVIKPLIEALQGNDLDLRRSSVIALLSFKGEYLVEPLLKVLETEDSDIKWRIASIFGRINDIRVIEPLIELLKDSDLKVQEYARDSLIKLTGQDFGNKYRDWSNWWIQQHIS